jgi:hypothetical protein
MTERGLEFEKSELLMPSNHFFLQLPFSIGFQIL